MSSEMASWGWIYLLVTVAFMVLAFVTTVLMVPSARNQTDGGYDIDLLKLMRWGLAWPLELVLFLRTSLVSLKEPWRHELLLASVRKAERDRYRANV